MFDNVFVGGWGGWWCCCLLMGLMYWERMEIHSQNIAKPGNVSADRLGFGHMDVQYLV